MQNVDVNALLQGLQTLLAGGAQPGVNNGAQVVNQTTEVFPPGIIGKVGGIYQAESVNDLYEVLILIFLENALRLNLP